jgi:trans-aconitate methyltransferase
MREAHVTSQIWNAETYDRNARFVTDLGGPVLQLLAPERHERILDVGCGDGVLTKKIADRGCEVIGVDSSEAMIKAARALGLQAFVLSAYELDFASEFDAAFSNAALHWMKDPDRVIQKVSRALRPKGRFVGEMGGHGCVKTVHQVLIDELNRRGYDGLAASPWYFPTVEDYAMRLAAAGFEVSYIELIPRPTPLPGDVSGWLSTFCQTFSAALPERDRLDYLGVVRARIKPQLCDEQGRWTADYVRLRFECRLKH